ncbi:bifunctional tetrahydrofolate synthase/dihydrofolate synthase [Alkalimonas amylolytica]|uniref:Dihydrofolate synthase/folylpolyglutamate synthase n=1 Tax=Alkalimonas amylolytica TaxID=152573 RepID=A0A1H4F820_ALKAM|nr:bifunctional tetrahydrofolate synthase/dihydrofolate synthase [Alkalimonas amylolytica]SEA92938.1 dihydrofolate synthase / folylpolyglutamate synthase [Alkalimonas amylolytica]
MSTLTSLTSQSCQTLDDWLCFIEQQHPQHKIELGLERVRQVAERAGLQQLPGRVVLIAGTNGKGTTARCMEQLLLAQGLTVAVYSSPHLLRFNERLRFNLQDATDADWVRALAFIEQLRQDIELTYFEFTTLAAFYLIKDYQPDVALIEVGLGGRLDATNIVEPELSILTTIDLDHQDWLGPDREAIGREKAGVFRTNRMAVVAEQQLPASVLEVAASLGTQLLRADQHYHWQAGQTGWNWQSDTITLTELPLLSIPVQNAATALMAVQQLGLLPEEPARIRKALAGVTLAGRMQWLQQHPSVLVDVAHNPQSIQYLAQQLRSLQTGNRRLVALCGMMRDKVKPGALDALIDLIDHWALVSLPGPRGAAADLLQDILPASSSISRFGDVRSGFEQIMQQLQQDDLLLVFGSFVTVSAVLGLTTDLPEAK